MSLLKLPSDASDVEETNQFFDAPLNVSMEIPRCPKFMEWNYRALSLCDDIMKYTCLDISSSDMKGETCGGPRVEISGGKPNLNNDNFDNNPCPPGTFQQSDFISIGRSDCELLKSLCTEIGSIVSKVGSSSVDTSCRCDYIESFAPVGLRDIHDCKPGRFEDCSCYLVECLPGEILSPGGLGWVPKILITAVVGGLLFYGVRSAIKKRRQPLALKDVPAEDGFNQTK